jgi:AraC family transcriptional regulator
VNLMSSTPRGAGSSPPSVCAPVICRDPADWSALAASSPEAPLVLYGECDVAMPPPWSDRPTLRTMRRGSEIVALGRRWVRLDEDVFVVVRRAPDRPSVFEGGPRVRPLLVVFGSDALVQSQLPPDAEADEVGASRHDVVRGEALHASSPTVAACLAGIEARLLDDDGDPFAWEDCLARLLAATRDADRSLRERAHAIDAVKPATRRELLRRVLLASDFIQSRYDEPIGLHDIAQAAHLSRFHLVRLFQRVHGLSPHRYLVRKRLAVALRLVDRTSLALDEIAAQVGLGDRSSLFRMLRRHRGHGAATLRRLAAEHAPCITSA